MNKIQNILTRYFFIFPIFILILNFNGINRYLRQFNYFILSHTSKTEGSIVSVSKIEAVNGTFFDCNIKYIVSGNDYFLLGTISYDDRTNVKISDTITVRYNLKNPTHATIESIASIITLFGFSIFIISWSFYGLLIIFRRWNFFYLSSKK